MKTDPIPGNERPDDLCLKLADTLTPPCGIAPAHASPVSASAIHSHPRIFPFLIGGSVSLAVAMGIGRFAYTPILPTMERTAHLDPTQAGLLASVNYIGYLVGALMTAVIARRAARGMILRLCLVMVVLTTGLMASVDTLVAWGIIRFLSGLASAGVFVLTSGLVLDLLRRRQLVSLSGWLYSGVGLGIATSGMVVRAVDATSNWRGDWLTLGLLAAALVALVWRWLPATPLASAAETPPHTSRVNGAQMALALLFIAYLCEGTGYVVTGTFLVAIVNTMPGLSGTGPSVWIVVGLAAAPAGILWSRLASRIGLASALSFAYIAQACGIILPAVHSGVGVAFVAAILFGGTFLGITTLTLTLAGRIAPQGSSTLIGVLTAVYGGGQIVGPTLAGVLTSRTHSFSPALAGASAIVLIGGVLMVAFRAFAPVH